MIGDSLRGELASLGFRLADDPDPLAPTAEERRAALETMARQPPTGPARRKRRESASTRAKRAIAAAESAGMTVSAVTVAEDGSVSVTTAPRGDANAPPARTDNVVIL